MILNPWDSEAYSVHTTDGIMSTMWVPNGGGRVFDTRQKEHQ